MPFPTTTITDATNAQSSLANQAVLNGLTAVVGGGQNAVQDAVLANLLQGLPGSTILGVSSADAGAGVTGGVGTVVRSHVTREGGLICTRLYVDLRGLTSSTTDLGIIGTGTSNAFLTQITTAVHGTIIGGNVSCLEVPAGGQTDIDMYLATVNTGRLNDVATGLAGQAAVMTSGGAFTLARIVGTSATAITTGTFLYLTSGAAGTAATYTAGRLLITLYGV